MNPGFSLIQRFVREASGLSLDDDKYYLIEDRLKPLMRAENIPTLVELARRLHVDHRSDLANRVAETLTINETSFFRDKHLFTAFGDELLPALIERRKTVRRLRILCAGCSTGQEPYSLAMIIDEKARGLVGWRVEIVATDLSRSVIEFARHGLYTQFEVQRGLPVTMLLRHFQREADRWRLSDALRAKVDFKPRNLMNAVRDLGSFDFIFCRNVMIYFDVATKRRVLASLCDVLHPDGYLVLGAAESVSGLGAAVKPVPDRNFLFVRDHSDVASTRAAALHAAV